MLVSGIRHSDSQYFYILYSTKRADSLEKNLTLGKTEGRSRGATEDEMIVWHHQLNEHEFEQTSGDSEGQASLACCISPWGGKESDMTQQLNNSNKKFLQNNDCNFLIPCHLSVLYRIVCIF